LDKTKTINPELIADISVYSCLLPILVFLFIKNNWKEKLKWVCLFLLVINFSFDQLGSYFSRIPVSKGTIVRAETINDHQQAALQITKGRLHEGEFFSSNTFAGSVSKIVSDNGDTMVIELNGNSAQLSPGNAFQVYSTIWLSNILRVIELSLIFLLFHLILKDSKLWSKVTLWTIILSVIVWVCRNILLDNIHTYGELYNGGATLLIIVFSLAYFYKQLNNPENLFVYSTPSFWIVVAVLLYKAGTFFLFLYTNSLSQNEKENFYLFNSVFYLFQNVLIAIAFMIPAKTHYKKQRITI
jgi:hypothetical protein